MDLIDTHLHLIQRDVTGHAWTRNEPALAGRDFTLDDARRLYGGRVRGSIFMEVDADDFQAESRWIAGLVRQGELLGQIANCRPETDDGFEPWLDECADLGVVGMRRILHTVADDVSTTETFRANVRRIGGRGLPFDMNFLGRTLPIAYDLAAACPDMTFVLDHCGTPDIAGGDMDPWREGMARLASLPHVNVKLSGISAYAPPGEGDPVTLRPWIDHLFETFGPERIVWGSDWPVVNLGRGLPAWLDVTEAVLRDLSADERAAVGWKNAERIYKVNTGLT
ncbi:amidohydrolase family protein [Rubellimicrobium arenae]|uniref:amidohydrolase family protein n=1 Tax=Rubellimicrobium arenae TaxID=2817372 RepID=UPI001B30E4F4|nr:amidohydrolase [Rubellimicrobium arenae]